MTNCLDCGKKLSHFRDSWHRVESGYLCGSCYKKRLENESRKCYDCGKELPIVPIDPKKGTSLKPVHVAVEKGKIVGRICSSCFLKRLGQDGFTVKEVQMLKESLKELDRKLCLDCVFCEFSEETVEIGGVLTAVATGFAGLPFPTETRFHLVCRKFLLNLDDKLESAMQCSSFLTEKEYHEKALKGEISGFIEIKKNEIESTPKPIIATCEYCRAKYDITLYRRCPNCGAFSPTLETHAH